MEKTVTQPIAYVEMLTNRSYVTNAEMVGKTYLAAGYDADRKEPVLGMYNNISSVYLPTSAPSSLSSYKFANVFATRAYVDEKVSDTAIIIGSSTEGSTKKFQITVDDSGTLTATEVTE